jgi:hypothetical protein
MHLRRRYITLLEIMIIVAILAAASGAAAFNIRKFYLQQQVLDDVNRVVNVLNTASELMMLVNLDTEVRFSESGGKIEVAIAPQSAVPLSVHPLLKDNPVVLSHLDGVLFRDGVQHTMLTPPFTLTFESKGFLMNRGILQLQGKGTQRYLIFRGYPAPFSPLSGNAEYEEEGFRDMVEKMTEQIRSQTVPPPPVTS